MIRNIYLSSAVKQVSSDFGSSSRRFYSVEKDINSHLTNAQNTAKKAGNFMQRPLLELSDKAKPWMPLLKVAGALFAFSTALYGATREIKGSIKEFRDELKEDAKALRTELKEDAKILRTELKEDAKVLRTELKEDIKGLNYKIDRIYEELKSENKSLAKKTEKQFDTLNAKMDKQQDSLMTFREEMQRRTTASNNGMMTPSQFISPDAPNRTKFFSLSDKDFAKLLDTIKD